MPKKSALLLKPTGQGKHPRRSFSLVCLRGPPRVNTQTGPFPSLKTRVMPPHPLKTTAFTYLGTQLGEERSTSQVAYRFMWTGRLEVMLTGLEGCGEGTPPVRGSPPRSDILEAERHGADKGGGGWGGTTRSSLLQSLVGPSSFSLSSCCKRVNGKLILAPLINREQEKHSRGLNRKETGRQLP